MADRLTHQVRSIASVTTAISLGDLSQQIEVDAQGIVLVDISNSRRNTISCRDDKQHDTTVE